MLIFVSGCDQKHEEEMDSEAIYNNFVLRVSHQIIDFTTALPLLVWITKSSFVLLKQVMAARSPNVRLRKALDRNASRYVLSLIVQVFFGSHSTLSSC